MNTEFELIDSDKAQRLSTVSWQLKALGQAIQCDNLSEEAKEWLAGLVEQLADELTYIAGEHVRPMNLDQLTEQGFVLSPELAATAYRVLTWAECDLVEGKQMAPEVNSDNMLRLGRALESQGVMNHTPELVDEVEASKH